MSRIRITCDEPFGGRAKIVYVANDGTETDVSDCFRAVDIRLTHDGFTTAKLEAIKVEVDVVAEQITGDVPTEARVEVTGFSPHGAREFLPAAAFEPGKPTLVLRGIPIPIPEAACAW